MNRLIRKIKKLDKRFRLGLPLLALLLYGTFAQYNAYQAGFVPPAGLTDVLAVESFDAEKPDDMVVVLVSGMAKRRGYFALPAEMSLRDFLAYVEPTADGDISAWDLAHQPQQGDQYYIAALADDSPGAQPWLYNEGEHTAESMAEDVKLINLNTATLEELQLLPGIGPSRAQAILDYRTEHQGFRYVQELLGVKGIGEKIYAQLKDRVTV